MECRLSEIDNKNVLFMMTAKVQAAKKVRKETKMLMSEKELLQK